MPELSVLSLEIIWLQILVHDITNAHCLYLNPRDLNADGLHLQKKTLIMITLNMTVLGHGFVTAYPTQLHVFMTHMSKVCLSLSSEPH